VKVPFGNLRAQYLAIKDDVDNKIFEIIDSCSFIKGKYVKEFEQNFADYCNSKLCIGTCSGSSAYIWLFEL